MSDGNKAGRCSKRSQNSLLELGAQFTNSHDLCDLGDSFSFHLHGSGLSKSVAKNPACGRRQLFPQHENVTMCNCAAHPIFVDALRVLDYEAHLAVGRKQRIGQIDADLESDCRVRRW